MIEVEPKRGTVKATAVLMTGNRIVYGASGLHIDRWGKQKARVQIGFENSGGNSVLSYTDLDIRDDQDRTRLANSARKHLLSPDPKGSPYAVDCTEWSESVNRHLLDEFCLRFPMALFESQGAKWGSAGPEITMAQLLIPGFVQANGGHVLFGPKGSGKTETGIIIARCLQLGLDLFGPVTRTVTPMFLQLERSETDFLRAVQVVNRALGLPIEEKILYRVERGRSLAGMVDSIERDVDKNNVDILITDSLSRMAEGGSLKDDNTANPIMDRLNAIAPCHFDLAHTSYEGKGDATKAHIFGSIHFGNAADVIIQIVRQRVSERQASVMFHVTDANAFSPGQKRYFSFEYDEFGLCNVRKADAEEFPDLAIESGLSPEEKRKMVYLALPRSKTLFEVSEETGLPMKLIDNTVRGNPKIFIKTGERQVGKGRPSALWGRRSNDEYTE